MTNWTTNLKAISRLALLTAAGLSAAFSTQNSLAQTYSSGSQTRTPTSMQFSDTAQQAPSYLVPNQAPLVPNQAPQQYTQPQYTQREVVEEPRGSTDSMGDPALEALEKRIEELEAEVEDNVSPYTAGYKKGFLISPRDKKKTPFELKINGRLQFRYTGFARDTDTFTNRLGTIDTPSRNDVEIERARLEFRGYVLDPRIKYYYNLDADTDDNHDVIFHDFWFDFDINDKLTLRVGKAKVPGGYEWLESSTTTRFADRSLSSTYFRADRSLGLWLLGTTERDAFWELAVTNGFNTTDLERGDIDNNFTYTGIYWIDPWGDAGKGFSDLEYHESPVVRIGASASYSNTDSFNGQPTAEQNFARVSDGARLTDTGAIAPGVTVNGFDQYFVSTFLTGKYRGFSFNSEFFARWLQNFGTVGGAPLGDINDLFDSGFYVDVGYFVVPSKLELNGRVSQIDGLFGDSWEYAAGFTYFVNETHKNKFIFDATTLDGSPTSSSSPNFEIGQNGVLYRAQYQIAF